MMRLKIVFTLLVFSLIHNCYGQNLSSQLRLSKAGNNFSQTEDDSEDWIDQRNAVYVEIFGNGVGILSGNYERTICSSQNNLFHESIRVGLSLGTSKFNETTIYGFPIEANTLVGKMKNHLEIGLGWTPIIGTNNLNDTLLPVGYRSNYNYAFTIRFGYRFVNHNGFLARIAPLAEFTQTPPESPVLSLSWNFGLSFGYAF